MRKIKIEIEGMTCGNCSSHVKKELEKIPGTKGIKVSHETGEAVLKVEENVHPDKLKEAVKKAGYNPIKISLKKGFFS